MITNRFSMGICIAAMALTAVCCKKSSEQGGGGDVRSTAIASINAVPTTKTEYKDLETSMDVTWSSFDEFTAYNPQKSRSFAVYLTNNGSGKQAPFEGIWEQQQPAEGSMLYAIYPKGTLIILSDYKAIPIDLTSQTGQIADLKNKDYMRAKAPYNSKGATAMAFSHRIAVVKLVLSFPEGVTGNATLVGIKATGLNNKANLDLTVDDDGEYYKNKTAGAVNTSTNAIAIDGTNRTLTAYLAVLPETLSKIKVTAIVGNDSYEAAVDDITFKAGMMYTFSKTMTKQPEVKFAFTIKASYNTYYLPFPSFDKTGDYILTVNWGDNTENTIIPPHSPLSNYVRHDYLMSGSYQITITSSEADFDKVQMPVFKSEYGSHFIKSIDSPLLNIGVTDLYEFFKNSGLESIPEGLFDNNTAVTRFQGCFDNCSLTSIPKELFDKNIGATNFSNCFSDCNSLTSIPQGLFDKNIAVTNFSNCFSDCDNLTSIPQGLFDKNTAVTTFASCFRGCRKLTSIPQGLFDKNTAVTDFEYCFGYCNNLPSIPQRLFSKNMAVTTFNFCFDNCLKLALNSNILCNEATEKKTRFSGMTSRVTFIDCFYNCGNDYWNPAGGTAPALWEYTYGNGVTSTSCYRDVSNVSNAADIPATWK